MTWRLFISLVALIGPACAARGEFFIRPLVVDQSSPPWLPLGWQPEVVGNTYSIINNRGETVFVVRTDNSDSTEVALVGGPFDSLNVIAKTGDEAPGMPGVRFSGFGIPRLNDQGAVLFYAGLEGAGVEPGPEPPSNQHSIWLSHAGVLRQVMRSGELIEEAGSFIFSNWDHLLLGRSGECAMHLHQIKDSDGNEVQAAGLWVWKEGSFHLVYRAGDLLPDGGRLSQIYGAPNPTPILAGDGLVAYGRTTAGNETLWRFGLESHERLMMVGQPIDLGSAGEAIADGYASRGLRPCFCANDSGEVAFNAWTSVGPVVVRSKAGQSELVALWGETAPGTSGASFGSLIGTPVMIPSINDGGQVGLYASLKGQGVTPVNDRGIWVTRNGALGLVVRTGSPAPGRAEGVQIAGLDGSHFINSAGQMVFGVTLSGPGVDESNDQGIWFADANGALEPIVMEGDIVEIGDGETRVISGFGIGPFHSFYSPSGDDGKGTPFNDRTELVFYAEWTQPEPGAGYFVASRFRIHEVVNGNQGIEITFPSRVGKAYRLRASQNLPDASWTPAQNIVPGLPWSTTLTFPEPADTTFYVIEEVP